MPSLAFVTKRYDRDLSGGAETLVRQFSRRLVDQGYAVEILTTCIRDYHDWREVYPPGLSQVEGVPVRRFPIWSGRDGRLYQQIGDKIGNRLVHSAADGDRWWREGLHSPLMYQHLQRHGRGYQAVIVVDYSVSLSLYALGANAGRTIAWPLLHNEPFAYLPAVRRWLDAADGVIFNTAPERDFARFELGAGNPSTEIVGVGVQTTATGQANCFRQKYGVEQPYLLYVGRLDASKNLATLLTYFRRYKAKHDTDLRLVLMGEGPFKVPKMSGVLSLGYCPAEDVIDACAGALALCQPSLMESFAIVALEALVQQTPMLVHGANSVTRFHCLQGNAGLYFYAFDDFDLALDYLLEHPAERRRLGQQGRDYVLKNYAWDVVMDRMLAALNRFGLSPDGLPGGERAD